MQCMAISGESLSDLAKVMKRYPQVLINVKDINKSKLHHSEKIHAEIAQLDKTLDGRGRILVRASGTESLVRVMVEAESNAEADEIAVKLAEIVRSELS
jgi:phosphoglucosamine mutase